MPNRKTEFLTATQQVWLNHLKCCQAGGQTLAAYAKAKGLDLKTLYNWQYRLKQKGLLENSSGRFAPPAPHFQKVVVAPEAFRGGEVRLHWPSGFVLEFESGVDLGYVERLLEVLGGIPGC